MSLSTALWVLLAVALVVGIFGIVDAFRKKMRELAQREARAVASRLGSYRPSAGRAAARRSKPG